MKSKKLGLEPTHLSTRSPFADFTLMRGLSQEGQSLITQGLHYNLQLYLSSKGVTVRGRNSLQTTIPVLQDLLSHFVYYGTE